MLDTIEASNATTLSAYENISYMATVGPTLVANGYRILPIQPGTKTPGLFKDGTWRLLPSWQRYGERDTSQYEVDIWSRWPQCGVAIAAGTVIGIDIDVLDDTIAYEIRQLAYKMLGQTPAMRIGRAPKVLLAYRSDTPFRGRKRKPLEVLALGQQFLAYATHPETMRPYMWPEESLVDIDRERLPVITEKQALAWLDAAYALVPANLRPKSLTDAPETVTTEWRNSNDPRGTREAIKSALACIPNDDLDGASWVKVGTAIKAALGEDGRDLWVDWSRSSNKSGASGKSDTAERRWKQFRPTSVGAGTIFWLAEQRGWSPPIEMHFNETKAELARIREEEGD